MRGLALVAVALTLAGCAAKLTPAGARVREVAGADRVRSSCEFLGIIDAVERSGWDLADDRRGAMNQIRNRVAEMGGDAFLLVGSGVDLMGANAQAEAYSCGTEAPPRRVGA